MQRQRRVIVVSAVLHLAVLAIALRVPRIHVEPARFPGTAQGSRITLAYVPGRSASVTTVAAMKPAPSKVSSPSKLHAPVQQAAASVNSPQSLRPNAAQGGDALGQGNATVALAMFFPAPKPDLSRLAHGTRGDVVVDVTIDEQGKITESQVAQSMGSGIDDVVLATIQTWTFKPATKDGKAVPSQQELLFHYEHG